MASESWKKPTDIMRIHRLKRRSSTGKRNQIQKDDERHADNSAFLNGSQENRKRRNPFNCDSPSKLRHVPVAEKENSPVSPDYDDEDIVFSDTEPDNSHPTHRLFTVLNTVEQKLQGKLATSSTETHILSERNGPNSQKIRRCSSAILDVNKPDDSKSLGISSLSDLPQKECETKLHEKAPVDWSVKVKMRIVTQSAIDAIPNAKSSGEARAHVSFVQNVPLDGDREDSLMAALQRTCNFWIHPNLPWFPEFPRIVPDSKIRKQVPGDVGQNDLIQKALYNDWMASFTSAFQQLKSGLCPYFYLCCHNFTVLFRGQGVGGHTGLTACLTPTTRGIREALKRDGIEFSMPNLKISSQDKGRLCESSLTNSQADSTVSSQTESSQPDSLRCDETSPEAGEPGSHDKEDLEQEALTTTNEGASLWLEDMGLDRKSFPTLEPAKVKMQREGYQQVDRRAESLVFCEGCEVQALFNFLINCRSCTALTGPQAGIPPTILSPTSFVGATVRSNKIRHSVAKLSLEGETQDAHVLEINGPVLPHHHLNISTLLRNGVADTAVISYNTHDPTAPFNMENSHNIQEDGENVASVVSSSAEKQWEHGLHKSVRGRLGEGSVLERASVLREVKCHKDGFMFTCS